ncbi:MAG TPA: DNA alkylation repair protein, partial [Nitrososphaerales archaeon]|nr:DNA alkylation repair protein [Nitrososphaerales archaeon]
ALAIKWGRRFSTLKTTTPKQDSATRPKAKNLRRGAVLGRLRELSDHAALAGMGRCGINTKKAFGVSVPQLRKLAREIGKNHDLARQLWQSGYHEARILASMIDDPRLVTEAQIEAWANDFDSWDVCDQCCGNLFDKTSFAYRKAVEWSKRDQEFVKRASFALMAWLAFHDKKAKDEELEAFLPVIEAESTDERNYVRKAVNWALRQIGKRNLELNALAITAAERISQKDSRAARWIAAEALRELNSEGARRRIASRGKLG